MGEGLGVGGWGLQHRHLDSYFDSSLDSVIDPVLDAALDAEIDPALHPRLSQVVTSSRPYQRA
jgi:hypothetical protein